MSSIRMFPDSVINRLLIHTVTLRKRTKVLIDGRWGDYEDTFAEYTIKCIFEPWRRGEVGLFEMKGIGETGDARAWFKKEYIINDVSITIAKRDELLYLDKYYEIKQLFPYIDGTGNRLYEARLERVRP